MCSHIVTSHPKRKCLITVRSEHAKKFWDMKMKSLSGTLQIEIMHKILSTQKIPERALNVSET